MKKFIALIMLGIMMLSAVTTAFADNVAFFELNNVQAYSMSTMDVTYSSSSVYKPTASSTNHYIEVKHNVTSTSIKCNNLYHVVRRSTGNMVQQKWLTPGNDYVPISSTNAIVAREYYGVAARGNTDYSELYGIQYINMEGYMRAH